MVHPHLVLAARSMEIPGFEVGIQVAWIAWLTLAAFALFCRTGRGRRGA